MGLFISKNSYPTKFIFWRLLHFTLPAGWPFAKDFINQPLFLLIIIFPTKTPTINPHPYPITTTFQPNSNENFEPWFASKFEGGVGGPSELAHLLDNIGLPQNFVFPSNELFWIVRNCFPCGIGPIRLLWDTFKKARKVSSTSFGGVSPTSIFWERSSDSRFVKVA